MNSDQYLSEEEYQRKTKEIAHQINEAYYFVISQSDKRIPVGLALSSAAYAFCHLYENAFKSASAGVDDSNVSHFVELMETVRMIVNTSTDITKSEIERDLMKRLNKENE